MIAERGQGPLFSGRPGRSPAWFLTQQTVIAKEMSGFAPLLRPELYVETAFPVEMI